jgi:hypothetical protein
MARSRTTRVTSPTIAEVLARFLAEQQRRLTPKTFAQYRSAVELLQHSLDNYAYQSLDTSDAKRFDQIYNAKGDAPREFCDIFGPDHILSNLNEFLGYFMVRKVIVGKDLLRAAGTMTKKLAAWLAENGYAGTDEAEDPTERGSSAARDLPKAEELVSLLRDFAEEPDRGDEDNEVEDHFTLTRVERRRIWLEGEFNRRDLGPIAVPVEISSPCKVGWTISGVLGRIGRRWQLVEAWNVYPR